MHRFHSVQWKGKGKKKKKKDEDTRVDLYALLGLQNERYLASESEIRNGALCDAVVLIVGVRV